MRRPTSGMGTFFVVWAGQLVSVVGSGLTGFGLAVWVFQETGSTGQLALVLLATVLPRLIATPFAGALVDRWDRRHAMILSDTGAALGTLAVALLLFTDSLEVWHLYPALAFSAVFTAFQWPAYSAATTLLVPKEHYGRAAGLVQLAEALSNLVAPALAGVLLVTIGIEGVILIDVLTFLFAVTTLLPLRFPPPPRSAAGEEGAGSLLAEARFGLRYLRDRPGLLGLLVYFSTVNLFFGFIGVLIFPLVLAFASEAALGFAVSLGASGMLFGSIAMSSWGGPKRRISGVLGPVLILGLGMIAIGLRPSLVLVVVASFVSFSAIPIAAGSSQAIWQAKVDPDVQGRVFSIRQVAAQAMVPVSYLLAGPLADGVFEPLLAEGGALAGSVGAVIGVGEGRGIALLFMLLGACAVLATVAAYAYPRIRLIEDEIPDALETPASVTGT